MGRHDNRLLTRPPAPTRAFLGRWWRRPKAGASDPLPAASVDPLLEAGQQLRLAREARGLNLRQLAQETRISSAVIEALERGWRDRLPEATYLRTMLPLLEAHLGLAAGSLEAALPSAEPPEQQRRKSFVMLRFTPGSIDVFTTWQGTWIYAVLCLGLVYGLNLEQQRLAAEGLLALRPLAPSSSQATSSQPEAKGSQQLLKLFPDLRPLDQAARGQGLRILGRTSTGTANGGTGQLLLRLAQPSQIELQTAGGLRVALAGGKGELTLPVTTPFRLTLSPPPSGPTPGKPAASNSSGASNSSVEWNGQELAPLAGHRDQFALP